MRHLLVAGLLILALSALGYRDAFAVPAGQPCGGGDTGTCDKGLWCEPSACTSTAGICVKTPKLCIARKNSKSFQPVCGCNNKTYSSDCFRRAYKIGKLRDGKC